MRFTKAVHYFFFLREFSLASCGVVPLGPTFVEIKINFLYCVYKTMLAVTGMLIAAAVSAECSSTVLRGVGMVGDCTYIF